MFNILDQPFIANAHYYLLELNAEQMFIQVQYYKQSEFDKAATACLGLGKLTRRKIRRGFGIC